MTGDEGGPRGGARRWIGKEAEKELLSNFSSGRLTAERTRLKAEEPAPGGEKAAAAELGG
jgi:hypothetical protein